MHAADSDELDSVFGERKRRQCVKLLVEKGLRGSAK